MAGVRRYQDLIVWQLSRELRREVLALIKTGPVTRDFKFRDQIRDSASSGPRNIAEGFSRFNPAEFAHFPPDCQGVAERDPQSPGRRLRTRILL